MACYPHIVVGTHRAVTARGARRAFPCCGDAARVFTVHRLIPTMCMDPDYEIAECLSCGATLTTGDSAGHEEMARLRVNWERACGMWSLKRWPVKGRKHAYPVNSQLRSW